MAAGRKRHRRVFAEPAPKASTEQTSNHLAPDCGETRPRPTGPSLAADPAAGTFDVRVRHVPNRWLGPRHLPPKPLGHFGRRIAGPGAQRPRPAAEPYQLGIRPLVAVQAEVRPSRVATRVANTPAASSATHQQAATEQHQDARQRQHREWTAGCGAGVTARRRWPSSSSSSSWRQLTGVGESLPTAAQRSPAQGWPRSGSSPPRAAGASGSTTARR